MPLSALGPSTEAWFVDERVDHGDAVALRCPSDPSFRWGNLLLLAAPPAPGSRAHWEARFAGAFADLPDVRHTTLAWTGDDGALAELEAAGYEPDRNVVRVAEPDALEGAPSYPDGFRLRQVDGDDDWRTVLALQARDQGDEDPEAYREHRRRRAAFYRRIGAKAREGLHESLHHRPRGGLHGGWYLAELDGEPAGSMGVYVGGGLGRFQFVHVAPAHRRAGVATAMVHAVAREGFARWGARRLVIMGDEGSAADGIYARLGFRPVERYVGACRKEPPRRPGDR